MLFKIKAVIIGLGTLSGLFWTYCPVASASEYGEQQHNLRLLDRIDRIERDLIGLQKQFYRGGSGSERGTDKLDNSVATSLESRLDFVEEQAKGLIGRIEWLEHELSKILSSFDKLRADNEFRFSELEKKIASNKELPENKAIGDIKDKPGKDETNNQPKTLGTVSIQDLEKHAKTKNESAEIKTEDEFKKAFALLKSSRFDEAEKAFSKFIASHPDEEISGEAYYWLGEIHYNKKKYEPAAVNFLRGYKLSPKGNKAPDSLLKLASSLIYLKKNKDACSTLGKLNREFPKANEVVAKKAQELSTKSGCR